MKAMLLGLGLVAVAAVITACGGGDGDSDAGTVARRAVQALIDHDQAAYLNEVRSDQQEPAVRGYRYNTEAFDPNRIPGSGDLSDCKIRDVLVPDQFRSGDHISISFQQLCGKYADYGKPGMIPEPFTTACQVLGIEMLNGRAYLPGDFTAVRCEFDPY